MLKRYHNGYFLNDGEQLRQTHFKLTSVKRCRHRTGAAEAWYSQAVRLMGSMTQQKGTPQA